MNDLPTLLPELKRLRAEGATAALATVCKVEGPAYRRPGARMLVLPNGETIGAVSGGCLEQEVAEQGLAALADGAACVRTFSIQDDDPVLGFGTGCGGIIHVLVEPMGPDALDALLHWAGATLDARRPGAIATITHSSDPALLPPAARVYLDADGTPVGGSAAPYLQDVLLNIAPAALQGRRSRIASISQDGQTAEALVEYVRPPVRLVLFGDGYDVAPLARLGRLTGWEVVVAGGRPEQDLAGRFPDARSCAFVMHPEEALRRVRLDAWTATVVLSHHYLRDRAYLAALLESPAPYIGMLGPAERTRRMLDELHAQGHSWQPEVLERVHGPAGLDIGSETAEEIAVSIVAEIQAVFAGRKGSMLKHHSGAIHAPVEPA